MSYGRSHISTTRDKLSAMRGSSDPGLCHFTRLCHAALTARAAVSGFQKSATASPATLTKLYRRVPDGGSAFSLKLRGSGCRCVPRAENCGGIQCCLPGSGDPTFPPEPQSKRRAELDVMVLLRDLRLCPSEARCGRATRQKFSLLLCRKRYGVQPERALSIHQAPANLS